MSARSGLFTFVFLSLFTHPAYAAGVDAILLVPVSGIVALIFMAISITISPKRGLILWAHFINTILFFVVLFASYYDPNVFTFLVIYPMLSTLFIIIIAMVQRNEAKYE